MSRSSRTKGKAGELEVCRILKDHGISAERNVVGRSVQDLVHDLLGVHIEVKRRETMSLHEWRRQAIADCPADCVPWVVHRRSRDPWLVTLELEHLLALLGYEGGQTT